MSKKLPHQRIPVPISLGKQQNAGGEAIDPMHDQSPLSLQLQVCDQQRQSGRRIGSLDRHSQKSCRFVDNDNDIIFIKDCHLPRETRPAPVFVPVSAPIFTPVLAPIWVA
jgi:hypothetical protein